jgi:EmrB/QacA subfamily drug resistance transporter
LAVAVLGTFMAFVDATIVNIAVPDIGHDFGSRLSSVSWVLNAYNIVFAAFLVGGGQLADLLGRRRVFVFSLALFTLASALCAASPSLGFLVAARTVQAAGAAMLVPSSLAIVLEASPEGERTHAIAMWSAVAALAAGIGPPLGGLLITASSWRLVFLVNIPVGVVAITLAHRVLVESRSPGQRRMPDLFGALILALAIAGLVLGVVKGPEWGWTSAGVVASFAIALLLGGAFVIRTGRHHNPLVDLKLFQGRAFAVANGVTVVMSAGFYAYTLCNVLFLTSVWRYSILSAGLALAPGPFTAIAVAALSSKLVARYGARLVAVPGALLWAAGMVYFARALTLHPDFLGRWLPGMVILGLGAGLTFPTLSGAAVGSVPGTRFAMATALNSVSRQIGAALGVAVLIAILNNPSPLGALDAFRHGWTFGAGCFIAGAAICLALVVRQLQTGERASVAAAGGTRQLALDDDPAADGLAPLALSPGEQATPAPQTRAEFLRLVPAFSELPELALAELAEVATDVKLHPGEWLFREGEDADAVFVLRVGQLEVVRTIPDFGEETVNELTRGAVLGELALLSGGGRRSASVRALRDSELVAIDRERFRALLRSEPDLSLGLLRALGDQLKASRVVPVTRRPVPVTIALVAASPVALLDLADELSRALCAWGRVAVLFEEHEADARSGDAVEGTARFAPLVDACEQEHDHVVMVSGAAEETGAWEEFCLSRADRVVIVASGEVTEQAKRLSALKDADLLGVGIARGSGALQEWINLLSPRSVFAVAGDGGERRADVRRTARRLAGRSLGVVLSGGGARAFSHLGALEVLLEAGLVIDRVAGVSMGAFIGALLADGHDSASMDACCYEEWVRRNPINDYTIPRHSLIRGLKAEAMLERVFGVVNVEELARPFYCASVDLRESRLVLHREGPLVEAVGASISLPLIAPPARRKGGLLIDGSLLDNLPIAPMHASGEGPVLAIDVKAGNERPRELRSSEREQRPERMPALAETMSRIALLSSANTEESARRYADLTIPIRVPGVGLLEFHQIDAAREAGRRAAAGVLDEPPGWLLDGVPLAQSLAGRRTVIRV